LNKKAVVLLSGGVDSTTTLAIARSQGYACYALSFDYGQRHAVELKAAKRAAQALGAVEHILLKIDLRAFGGSALTSAIPVPKNRSTARMSQGIPVTYVPARNTIFLAFALAFAEVRKCGAIFIGVNALDYSGYPDCRPEFLRAFQRLSNLATKAGVEKTREVAVHAPLMHKSKAQIIRTALKLGVDLGLTLSCYDPDPRGRACGQCDSCLLRQTGFAEARAADPSRYKH